jgi:hypothetical protein
MGPPRVAHLLDHDDHRRIAQRTWRVPQRSSGATLGHLPPWRFQRAAAAEPPACDAHNSDTTAPGGPRGLDLECRPQGSQERFGLVPGGVVGGTVDGVQRPAVPAGHPLGDP